MSGRTTDEPVLLTKAACRRLGLSRADVDRMFDVVPLIAPPDSRSVYVSRVTLEQWLEQWTTHPPGRTAA